MLRGGNIFGVLFKSLTIYEITYEEVKMNQTNCLFSNISLILLSYFLVYLVCIKCVSICSFTEQRTLEQAFHTLSFGSSSHSSITWIKRLNCLKFTWLLELLDCCKVVSYDVATSADLSNETGD